jgi:hypothetical protein
MLARRPPARRTLASPHSVTLDPADLTNQTYAVQSFDRRLRSGFTVAELTTLRELLQRLANNAAGDETPKENNP